MVVWNMQCVLLLQDMNNSDYRRLLSVTSHEIAHTWFQFLMATNESKHAWMDEGFTSYIDDVCLNEILDEGKALPNSLAYDDYLWWANNRE